MYTQLNTLRDQMRSDFEFTIKALARQRDVMARGFDAINLRLTEFRDVVLTAFAAQEQILHDHIAKTDDRFVEIINVVGDLDARVTDLEKRSPPAA